MHALHPVNTLSCRSLHKLQIYSLVYIVCSQEHPSPHGTSISTACCDTAGRAAVRWDFLQLQPRQRNSWTHPRKLGLYFILICSCLLFSSQISSEHKVVSIHQPGSVETGHVQPHLSLTRSQKQLGFIPRPGNLEALSGSLQTQPQAVILDESNLPS